jgi:hypothetical protein
MADQRYGERGYGRGDSIFSDDERGRDPGGRHSERGFLQRAGEEVKSWFGGDEDERRRQGQARARGPGGKPETWGGGSDWSGGSPYDDQYTSWRDRQIGLLDREYEEYCRHRQQQFEDEFHSWRQGRQDQAASAGAMPSGGATAQGGSRLTPDASSGTGTGGRSATRSRAPKANRQE